MRAKIVAAKKLEICATAISANIHPKSLRCGNFDKTQVIGLNNFFSYRLVVCFPSFTEKFPKHFSCNSYYKDKR